MILSKVSEKTKHSVNEPLRTLKAPTQCLEDSLLRFQLLIRVKLSNQSTNIWMNKESSYTLSRDLSPKCTKNFTEIQILNMKGRETQKSGKKRPFHRY